jgi:hypothetical protein
VCAGRERDKHEICQKKTEAKPGEEENNFSACALQKAFRIKKDYMTPGEEEEDEERLENWISCKATHTTAHHPDSEFHL